MDPNATPGPIFRGALKIFQSLLCFVFWVTCNNLEILTRFFLDQQNFYCIQGDNKQGKALHNLHFNF